MSHDEAWKRTLARLRTELGEEIYSSWFGRLELDDLTNGLARMSMPTRFLKSWIEEHYGDRILSALKNEIGGVARVQFVVRGLTRPAAASPRDGRAVVTLALTACSGARTLPVAVGADFVPPAPLAHSCVPAPDDAATGSPLDRRLTFETFRVGASNEFACSAARRIVGPPTEPASDHGALYIHAPTGLGKTHLLQAIAQAGSGEGRRVCYLTAERFMRDFVAALKVRRVDAFQNSLRGVDLLLLDNAQLLQGKSIQQEFGDTVNCLIEAGRQIVVAADRPPRDLENLEEPIRACLAKGLCVKLEPPDEILRIHILQARVAVARQACPSFGLSPAVLEFVARTIHANVRDLEEAVARLLAHAKLTGLQHNVESAELVIRDLRRAHDPRHIKIEDIQNLVASHYSMTKEDLLSPQKTAEVVKPRQVAMYLSKSLTLRSLPEIGRRFGGRDHTTVLYAVRKIENLARADRALNDEIEFLKRALAQIGLVSSNLLSLNAITETVASAC